MEPEWIVESEPQTPVELWLRLIARPCRADGPSHGLDQLGPGFRELVTGSTYWGKESKGMLPICGSGRVYPGHVCLKAITITIRAVCLFPVSGLIPLRSSEGRVMWSGNIYPIYPKGVSSKLPLLATPKQK
jgi:hypothetical protein